MLNKQTLFVLILCASSAIRCFDIDYVSALQDSSDSASSDDSVASPEPTGEPTVESAVEHVSCESDISNTAPKTDSETFGSDIADLLEENQDNFDAAPEAIKPTENNWSYLSNEYDSYVSDDLAYYTKPSLFAKAKEQLARAKSKTSPVASKAFNAVGSAFKSAKNGVVFAYSNPKEAFSSVKSTVSASIENRNNNFKDSYLALATIAKKAGSTIKSACSKGYSYMPSKPRFSGFSLPSCPKVSMPSMPSISFKGFSSKISSWFKTAKSDVETTNNAVTAEDEASSVEEVTAVAPAA